MKATDTVPKNSALLPETPTPKIPIYDSFVTYAVIALCVSFPYLLLLMPASMYRPITPQEIILRIPSSIFQPPMALTPLGTGLSIPALFGRIVRLSIPISFMAAIIVFRFACFFKRKAAPVKLTASVAKGNKTGWSSGNALKGFILAYGLLAIIFALFSMHDDPCNRNIIAIDVIPAITGCDARVVPPLALFCGTSAKVLLGLSITGCLIMSVLFIKTNIHRWQILSWSIFVWLLLASCVMFPLIQYGPIVGNVFGVGPIGLGPPGQ